MKPTPRIDALEELHRAQVPPLTRGVSEYETLYQEVLNVARQFEQELDGGKEYASRTEKPRFDEDWRDFFEAARKEYPGTRRGRDTEWVNFLKKYRGEVATIVPLLAPAIEEEKRFKEALRAAKKFVPEWANFPTWINQRRWEQEHNWSAVQATRPGRVAGALTRNGEHRENLSL